MGRRRTPAPIGAGQLDWEFATVREREFLLGMRDERE
jgi:hypothetical protein